QEQSKVPGRASVVGVAREGRTGVRLHTEPGDDNVVNSGAEERDDLWLPQDASDGYEGHEAWWAHSLYFPGDVRIPSWRAYVFMHFHTALPGGGQSNFHILNQHGWLAIYGNGGGTIDNPAQSFLQDITPIVKNVWYDFVEHVRWSSSSDGFWDV